MFVIITWLAWIVLVSRNGQEWECSRNILSENALSSIPEKWCNVGLLLWPLPQTQCQPCLCAQGYTAFRLLCCLSYWRVILVTFQSSALGSYIWQPKYADWLMWNRDSNSCNHIQTICLNSWRAIKNEQCRHLGDGSVDIVLTMPVWGPAFNPRNPC